ncbi:MAG: signal peptidase II [candidate division KSB1 bacterium]|nr:signal peptidase II [candidate division KSB1 bacterium]
MDRIIKHSRILLALLIIVLCLGCDQTTKKLAKDNLPRWYSLSYLGDTIRLQYVENPGVAFSIGAHWPEDVRWWLFNVGQGVFLLILAAHLVRNLSLQTSQFLGFVLILGGGIGNFTDRVLRDGRVIDFLNIGIGNLRTAIFNVADIAITTGLILLIYGLFVERSQTEDEKAITLTNEPSPSD